MSHINDFIDAISLKFHWFLSNQVDLNFLNYFLNQMILQPFKNNLLLIEIQWKQLYTHKLIMKKNPFCIESYDKCSKIVLRTFDRISHACSKFPKEK